MSPKHLDRAAPDICLAAKCECQKNGEEHEEEGIEEEGMAANNEEEMEDDSSSFPGLSVRCLRGPTNDSDFLALLQSLPADTRQLELRGAPGRPCQLHWSDNINRLFRLRRLALVDCGVPALSQAVRLPLLSQLHLAGNGLELLQLGSFLGLPMLQELDLSRNRISSLSTGAFLYLKNLRSLSLSHNRFGPELSTGNLLHGPRQLRVLELDGNRLSAKQLNDLFPDLTALERLELNHCGLNDAELWALNWSAVPQLRRVGLAGNNLTQVPSTSLRALAWLDTLDLRENLIRSLGPCIFCGMNVSRALLGRNLLGLSARPVHREAFAETRIRELDLGYNHFRHFDSEMLAGAQPWVEVLHLSGNSLSLDSPGLIRTLPRLRELHMAECGLASSSGVPYSLPKQFQQLTLLNLSGNGLDHLPPNLGSLLPQLQVLDISHNRFSSLPHQLWPFVDSLRLLFLHHCPWDCECAAQPLQLQMLQRLAQRELLRFEDTRCAEPPLLRGQPLHRVQRINDCAVLFGTNFGITQNTELLLILAALLVAAFFFSLLLLLLLYCGREAKQKGTYVTGEKKPLAAKEPSSNGNGLLLMNNGGKGGAGGLLAAVGNGTTTSSTGGLLALSPDFGDLSPPAPLGDGPVSSTMLRPLTVQGLAREKQPLLDEADWNHNCIGPVTRGGGGGGTLAQPSLLLVQSKGPRHPLPAQQQQQQRSTLLTF